MDDFVRTVGERSLTKLYDEATTLISKGSLIRNVAQLKNVLTAMDLVLEPLSKSNTDYRATLSRIREELKDAETKEGKRSIVDSAPAIYTVLTDWFRHLNYVIDDNNLLFSSSMVYQEKDVEKWEGDDDKTPL
jgi:cyclopropane fatty-acyl-phospholipid synthase-like methyltransferase